MNVTALIEEITATHHACLRREVSRLEQLAGAVPCDDEAIATDVRQLVVGLRACVESQLSMEEGVLFPMILRLQEQTLVTPCRAGMIRARASQAERDLARVRGVVLRLRDLARELAGDKNDESEFVQTIEGLLADLRVHTQKESQQLFPWALAREVELTASE